MIPTWLEMREFNNRGLFGEGLDYAGALDLSIASLNAYGAQFKHWVIAYSGGKDSSALVSFVVWAIREGRVPAPETLTILYADTGMELPPLVITARKLLSRLADEGYTVEIVMPPLEKRYWVQILGRGMQPPTRERRWCTRVLKGEPMNAAVDTYQERIGGEFLTLLGVRQGESAARDGRIAVSCSKNGGECGQGWFYHSANDKGRANLSPILHWRVCHVWKWLYREEQPYRVTRDIAAVYAVDDLADIRTGCIACEIVSRDYALEYLVKVPEWAHLKPLLKLTDVYAEMREPKYRKRKVLPFKRKDGTYGAKPGGSLGPLIMDARAYFLERVREIEREANYTLISSEEEGIIREMWTNDVWPNRWDGTEINGDVPYDRIAFVDGEWIKHARGF